MAVDVNQLNSYLTSTVPTSEARGEGTPIEVIPPPGESASVPTGTDGTVPIEVEQPPQVDQALYQIEFHRKIYGASVDVLETLERITYVDSYTDSTMRLNIAYIKFWKRGNTRPAGESTTVSGPDYQFGKINDTELVFQDIARVPDNVFVPNNVSVDQASPGWKTITDPATILGTLPSPQTSNTTKSEPEVNTGPSSVAPAPNYSSGEALQYVFDDANIYRFIDNGDINTTDYGSIALSNTALTIDRNAGNLQLFVPSNDLPQTKPTLPSTREEALSKIRAELETAKAATPPDQDLITYLEQTLAKVEQSSPEQYEQGLDLPPDPRQQIPTYESPTTERVQVADVIGGMSENYSRYDPEKKTEKTEGIWQFLFNPQTLERSFGPEYKEANTWGNSEGNPMHFSGFKNEELRFRDILLNGYMFGRKVESLIEGIRDLVSVNVAEGHQSPRVLEFIWGSKTFGPCIMTDISVNEEMWDGGEVVNARLSFTLKKIPEWVINDEYVNIFSPSGQPVQMIIIQPEKPAETTTDSTPGGADDSTSYEDSPENSVNKDTYDCRQFRDFLTRLVQKRNAILQQSNEVYNAAPTKEGEGFGRGINYGKIKEYHARVNSFVNLLIGITEPKYLKNKYVREYIDNIKKSNNRASVNTIIKEADKLYDKTPIKKITKEFLIPSFRLIHTQTRLRLQDLSAVSKKHKCGWTYQDPDIRDPAGASQPRNTTEQRISAEKCERIKVQKKKIEDIKVTVSFKKFVVYKNISYISGQQTIDAMKLMNSALNEVAKQLGTRDTKTETRQRIDNWLRFGTLFGGLNPYIWLYYRPLILPSSLVPDPSETGCADFKRRSDRNYELDGFNHCKGKALEIVQNVIDNYSGCN